MKIHQLIPFLCALPLSFVPAQVEWTNPGTGSWFDGTNWSLGFVPVAGNTTAIDNGGTAQINGGGAGSTYLQIGTSPGEVGTVVITNGANLSIDGFTGQTDVGISGTGTVTVSNGSNFSSSNVLRVGATGSGQVIVMSGSSLSSGSAVLGELAAGEGDVTLSGGSSWTSGLTVVGSAGTGTVSILGGSALTVTTLRIGDEAGALGAVTVNGVGSTLTASSGTIIVGNAGTGSLVLNLFGTASATQVMEGVGGTGTVTFSNGGIFRLTGNQPNLFAGFEDGDIQITNSGTIDTQAFDATTSVGLQGGGLLKIGTGTLTLTGANTVAFLSVEGGTATLDGVGATFNLTSGLQVATGAGTTGTINLINNSSAVVGGFTFIGGDGTGTLNLSGGSTVELTSSLFFGGAGEGTGSLSGAGTRLDQAIATTSVGHAGTGLLSVSNGAVFTTGGIATVGRGEFANGTLRIEGAGSEAESFFWNFGLLNSSVGVAQLRDGGTLSGPIALGISAGATGRIEIGNGGAPGIVNAAGVNGGDGSGLIRFNHNAVDYFFTNTGTSAGAAVTITGSTAVELLGTGRTSLTGTHTYSGSTTVSAGDLRVLGTLSNSAVSVASGATLSGPGTISQQVTIANGGHIAPGTSAGTLNTGTLLLNNTSLLDFELDTPDVVGGGVNDLINVTGDLTLDGVLNIADLGGFGDGTYRLFNYSGTLANSGLTFGFMPSLFEFTLDLGTANQVNLLVEASTSQNWDGPNTMGNGVVNGGTGTWDAGTTNWTNESGAPNTDWAGNLVANFAGVAGTVTIANGFTADPSGLSFETTGYTIAAAGTGNLSIAGSTPFVVIPGAAATISAPITGTGLLLKDGAGSLVLTGANVYTGGTTVLRGALLLNGGSITHAANAFTVGAGAGTGTVILSNGAIATTGTGVINNLSEVIVGTGSLWDSGTSLTVGGTAGGTLTIRTGGIVEADEITVNTGGLARVADATSQLSGDLIVGLDSSGTLIVESGAQVDATNTVIASDSGTGVAVVQTGASMSGNSLAVGQNGVGSLVIRTGGSLAYTFAEIGENAGSEGAMTIDGAGSSATVTTAFVGAAGTGTLNLQQGGTLVTTTLGLAEMAGSVGTLNIGTGGAAGILNGDGVSGGAGTALINFNHTDADYAFTGDGTAGGTAIQIVGSTTVRHSGPGTTTLVGANSYTGGTQINGGTLRISDDASLGAAAGGLSLNGGMLDTTATIEMARATTLLAGGGTFNTSAGTSLTHRGAIGGAGALTKTGAGTLVLAGNNSYAGGTSILQGTLRVGDGGTQGSVTGDIQNEGALVFDRADSTTFGGRISGSGDVTKTGEGTLTFTGENIYTSGTTINQGTLRIGDGGTTGSIRGDVTNNGELMFDRSDDVTFGGSIDGRGALTKRGAGILTLTGNAAHTGGTTIAEGALQIGDGGTRGSIQGDIRNQGVLAFNRSDLVTYSGNISGAGDLLQLGQGSLVLTGNNRHTGATEVRNGALFVNGSLDSSKVTVFSGTLLGGSGKIGGDVIVRNGGILSPGNSPGILNLGSLSLSRRSMTIFEIKGTRPGSEHDLILVDRTASLGGTLKLEFGRRFTPEEGDKIFLVRAGKLLGRFNAVDSNLGAVVDLDLLYKRSSLSLEVEVGMRSYTDFAGNGNQAAVATNLDEVAADGEMPRLISLLNTLSGPKISVALHEISPDALGAMTDVAKRYNRVQGRNLLGRLQEWRDTDGAVAGHASSSGLRFTSEDAQPMSAKGSNYAAMTDHGASTWSLFASGTGQLANVASDGNGAGYDFTTAGMTLGADKNLGFVAGGTLVGGLYTGYAGSDVNIDGNGGTIDANAAKFGLFGGWYGDNLYLSSQIGGGVTQYDTRRDVLNQRQTGDTTGYEFTTETAVGYNFEKGSFRFAPEAALAYNYVSVDSFTESGGLAPLKIDEQTLNSLQSRIGFRSSYELPFSDGHWLKPALHASWAHEFLDLANSIDARFASGAGGVFSVTPTRQGRDTAIAGASLSFGHESNWNTWFGYKAEGAKGILVHTLNAGASIRF